MPKNTKITAKQAIALKCLECCCEDWDEVFKCPSSGKGETTKCFLYDLRPRTRMDKLKTIFFDKDGSRSDMKFSMKKEKKKLVESTKDQKKGEFDGSTKNIQKKKTKPS